MGSGTQIEDIDDLLRQGIAAARAGQRDHARALLMCVVERDEASVSAWMWLSGVVDDLEDREVCMENVLALDPGNEVARRGLAWVRAEKQKRAASSSAPAAASVPAPAAASVPPAKEPWDHPVDPYLCPYCASPTRQEDRACPTCGGNLWVQVRRRQEPSWWLMNVLVVQAFMAIFFTTLPFVVLTFVAARVTGEFDPFSLLPVYLGLAGDVSPEDASVALEQVPRLYVLLIAGLDLLSWGMLVVTWLRWKPAFYLLIGQCVLLLIGSIVAAALGRYVGLICGGVGGLLAIALFFIVLQLEDDLVTDARRVYYAIRDNVKGGVALLTQGRSCARQEMWALAILYLRAAVAKMPEQIAPHLELAMAYVHLGRHDMARRALQEARRWHPDHPRLAELAALLNSASGK